MNDFNLTTTGFTDNSRPSNHHVHPKLQKARIAKPAAGMNFKGPSILNKILKGKRDIVLDITFHWSWQKGL
jgi:hypothetical protein